MVTNKCISLLSRNDNPIIILQYKTICRINKYQYSPLFQLREINQAFHFYYLSGSKAINEQAFHAQLQIKLLFDFNLEEFLVFSVLCTCIHKQIMYMSFYQIHYNTARKSIMCNTSMCSLLSVHNFIANQPQYTNVEYNSSEESGQLYLLSSRLLFQSYSYEKLM